MDRRATSFLLTGVVAIVLSGCASAPSESLAGVWTGPSGAAPRLELALDGSLLGDDGCNGIGGRWVEVGPGRIEARDMAMSLMDCPGVPDQWLGTIRTAEVVGDALIVRDADGAEVGVLFRD